MHFKLIYPVNGSSREYTEGEFGPMNTQNQGFDPEYIVARFEDLRADGRHTYELVDGEALSTEERGRIYIEEAYGAVQRAGNRYSIRRTYGSNTQGGGPDLGTQVPSLIVFEHDAPVGVYPHELKDGSYVTISAYAESLA
jgi:hypothetical protein